MEYTCEITGKKVQMLEQEIQLRSKFGLPNPTMLPQYRFRHLFAFWQHWSIYPRKCEYSGKDIISVFGPDCPYPVWYKEEWIKNNNPPSGTFDETKDTFKQLWELFQKCPISHNVGANNENCEYTDDCWYSRNCYLLHSAVEDEDVYYSYRVIKLKNCYFCVYSFNSELCIDLINCDKMYNIHYALHSKNCRDSSFLYDCRSCSDCFMCWNLRNKKYCFFNKQLSKEEYEQKIKEWDLGSRTIYEKAKGVFKDIVENNAYHRAVQIENCENSEGDYLLNDKNCHNCYFINDLEDCFNVARGGFAKDMLDTVCPYKSELLAYSTMVQDNCYDVKLSYNVVQCRFLEYCAHCFQCENCFMCCGLVGKKYHILNKEYSPENYKIEVERIKNIIKQKGEYGRFFPGYFAANPYEESLARVHFPLSREEQQKLGFRTKEIYERKNQGYLSIDTIPDHIKDVDLSITQKIFWDEKAQKPFQIKEFDIEFCKKQNVPIPYGYYINRILENFSWLYFNGELRETICAVTGKLIKTSLPSQYDGRILSEEAYLEKIV